MWGSRHGPHFMKHARGAGEDSTGPSSSSSGATMTRSWLAGDGCRQAHVEVLGQEE